MPTRHCLLFFTVALSAAGCLTDLGEPETVSLQGDALEQDLAVADVVVRIDPTLASSWRADKRIFGKFMEHNGRDAYPGLYDQHLANGSFEDWYVNEHGEGTRTELLYDDVPTFQHIAFPWQPRVEKAPGAASDDGPTWERPAGGPNGGSFQRVYNHGDDHDGGVRQRLFLPDERTLEYDIRVHVRGSATATAKVRLEDAHDHEILAELTLPLTDRWQWHKQRLVMSRKSGTRYRNLPPFGEYQLVIVLDGEGELDVDGAMLMAGDAVNGKYNPTTIALFRSFGVTSMRWPGGNVVGGYHWEDGIGPLWRRPIKPNRAWGGLEPHHLGTDEYLELCELAGLEPFLNVGFSDAVTPAEAARWVEYVNGAVTTPMGALRAQNGHPEPYGVKLWQVGNEVYGPYQIGHTNAGDYARGFKKYVAAMKAVDPSITIIAAGIDPYYTNFGGNQWNDTLLRVGGQAVEAIDIHRYVNGIHNDAARNQRNPDVYNQTLVAFPTQFEDILKVLRRTGRQRGVPDLDINVGEWNLQAKVSPGWPRPDYPTMAYATFEAGMYNAFLRQGDAVRYAYQRDNTLFFRGYRLDTRPPHPGVYTTMLYAEPFLDGLKLHHLPVDVNGPTFDAPATGQHIRARQDVPYVDVAALLTGRGDRIFLFVVNRDLKAAHKVRFEPEGFMPRPQVKISLQQGDAPFAKQRSWDGPETFWIEESTLTRRPNGHFALELPPASVARVELRRPMP